MLRKILLGLTLFTVLISCKKVDPELPVEITFKPKTSFQAVGTNDTAYVTTSGDGKADIVKFVSSNTSAVSIIQEGKDFVIFKQKTPGTEYFITAGLISSGQLKSQDTLWLKGTGTGIVTKGNIAYIKSSYLYTLDPNTQVSTYIPTNYNYNPASPAWTPDKKGILVNDSYYGGFYIYNLSGTYLSSNSSYNVSSAYYNSRFSLDGKAIYGYNNSYGCYVKDYNTKTNIILPISPSNSSIYTLAIGSVSDNIAYVTYSNSYYRLYHYKNGVTTQVETSYYGFPDIAVSPDGQYVAYIAKTGYSTSSLKLYNKSSGNSTTVDYPYYSGYNLRSPSFSSASDMLTYSIQYGNYSGTYATESVIVYRIKTYTYSILTSGQQPAW